jgi:hypothetical protein
MSTMAMVPAPRTLSTKPARKERLAPDPNADWGAKEKESLAAKVGRK